MMPSMRFPLPSPAETVPGTGSRLCGHGMAFRAAMVMGVVAPARAADEKTAEAEKPTTYEDHVATILKKHCATCHGDGK